MKISSNVFLPLPPWCHSATDFGGPVNLASEHPLGPTANGIRTDVVHPHSGLRRGLIRDVWNEWIPLWPQACSPPKGFLRKSHLCRQTRVTLPVVPQAAPANLREKQEPGWAGLGRRGSPFQKSVLEHPATRSHRTKRNRRTMRFALGWARGQGKQGVSLRSLGQAQGKLAVPDMGWQPAVA